MCVQRISAHVFLSSLKARIAASLDHPTGLPRCLVRESSNPTCTHVGRHCEHEPAPVLVVMAAPAARGATPTTALNDADAGWMFAAGVPDRSCASRVAGCPLAGVGFGASVASRTGPTTTVAGGTVCACALPAGACGAPCCRRVDFYLLGNTLDPEPPIPASLSRLCAISGYCGFVADVDDRGRPEFFSPGARASIGLPTIAYRLPSSPNDRSGSSRHLHKSAAPPHKNARATDPLRLPARSGSLPPPEPPVPPPKRPPRSSSSSSGPPRKWCRRCRCCLSAAAAA